MSKFPLPAAVQGVLLESRALSAALAVIGGHRGDREEAQTLVRQALEAFREEGVEGLVSRVAMRRILGETQEPQDVPLETISLERRIFSQIAQAWVYWATEGDRAKALGDLRNFEVPESPKSGALHLMALGPWRSAVEALLCTNLLEAKRLYHRASELGGQFGTETNPAIQWSYAASFWC